MPHMVLTVGAPGCGKTTLARGYQSSGYASIARDDMRVLLFGSKKRYWRLVDKNPDMRTTLENAYHGAVLGAVLARSNIILPNTHIPWDQAEKSLDFAKKHGYDTCIRVLDCHIETLLKRNEMRPTDDYMSEDDIRTYHQKFSDTNLQWWKGRRDTVVTHS